MQELQDKLLHVYITDSLKAIAENTAHAVQTGTVITKHWLELTEPKKEEKVEDDPRSCREITVDIFKRIRGGS